MEGKLNLTGRIVQYEIKRSNRARRITVRVDLCGTVKVTAPQRVSVAYIERSLYDVSDFILKSLADNERKKATVPHLTEYGNGEVLSIFGRILELAVFPGKSQSVSILGDCLLVRVKEPYTAENVKRAVNAFLRAEVERAVSVFSRKCYSEMNISTPFPKIVYRNAVSRWGRCTPARNELMFNYALYAAPIESVEYVVYHEFAHFFELNHSKKFYAIVAKYLPDWKSRRAKLKNIALAGKLYYV